MQAIDESTTSWDEATPDDNPLEQFTDTLEVREMASLKELLKEMSGEIPGFQAASVSGLDGLSIAEYTASPDFNMEMAAAQFALVMKLVQKSTGQLKSGDVEDNLVTSNTSYILSRFLGDGHYFLVIAVERDMASLGNVRLMTRNFAPDLWDAIPRRTR
jgi:predicted regulator of Ras-like GTPase activity (Roadblock/LC7/MglB family)